MEHGLESGAHHHRPRPAAAGCDKLAGWRCRWAFSGVGVLGSRPARRKQALMGVVAEPPLGFAHDRRDSGGSCVTCSSLLPGLPSSSASADGLTGAEAPIINVEGEALWEGSD